MGPCRPDLFFILPVYPLAPEGQLLCMATRAESSLARKSNEELRLALGADDPCEPVFEDAAIEVLVDGPSRDLRPQGPVAVLESFVVGEEEVLEVLFEDLVEGRTSGPSRSAGWPPGSR